MPNADNKLNLLAEASGPFKPHGQLALWTEGSVMHVLAEGPFNREAVQAFGAAMKQLYLTLPPEQEFVYLLEFRTSLMASPEALQAYGGFLQAMSAVKRAPKLVAFVVPPEVEGAQLMLPHFARLYAEHGRQFAAFEALAPAEDWLRTHWAGAPD